MCDSLGIEAKPNNGTLRLPLKPVGLHSDKPTSTDNDLPDLSAETSHIDNSLTETIKSELADSPETNAQVDGASTSSTKTVDPVNNSPIEATKTKVADYPETKVQDDGVSTSDTKPVDPVKTDILIGADRTEGIVQMKNIDAVF